MSARFGQRPAKPVKEEYSPHSSQLWRRLYYAGCHNDEVKLEKLILYQPTGYHPIDLGDELHHGRFRVIHKLGYGGFSTVWLCRDQSENRPTYVAVKVLVAGVKATECRELHLAFKLKEEGIDNQGHHLCLPKEQFTSESRNGTHICLVYPVLGPTVDQAASIFEEEQNFEENIRKISRGIVEALAILHRRGICHADFRPANIVLGLQSLDGLQEEQVLAQLGKPCIETIKIREDSKPTPEIPYAPKQLVHPVDFYNAGPLFVLPQAVIIDFGLAVETAVKTPPRGIPTNYAAPELIRHGSGGQEMDLWSLACALYEVRVGERLFDVPELVALEEADYDEEISSVLGRCEKGRSDQKIAREICKRAFGDDVTSEKMKWAKMLASLLKYEPEKRVRAEELLTNAWLVG